MDINDTDSDIKASLETLRNTVENLVTTRQLSGTSAIGDGNVSLFYRNKDSSKVGCIDFASKDGVADSDLEDLVSVCEEAKFGLGDKDVLDPSYRKAWKLDASQFAFQFDLVNSGILEAVHDSLLQYDKSSLVLKAHLDKMNVYGPGSFFKSHVDTPRNKHMIATLVIVLPTEHKGGDLLLMDTTWTFNSSEMVSKTNSTKPQLAFVAFYSDIEHEVTPVESGYRVSITYNLSCSKQLRPQDPQISLRTSPEEQKLREVLHWVLSKPEILPKGGIVAFGLTYQYPIDIDDIESLDEEFEGILKGADALLERVCESLNLKLKVQALFTNSRADDPTKTLQKRNDWDYNEMYLTNTTDIDEGGGGEDASYYFKKAMKKAGYVIRDPTYAHKNSKKKAVLWLTLPKAGVLEIASPYVTYGNDASLEYIYGRLILTAKIPAPHKRKEVFEGTLDADEADSEGESSSGSGSENSDGSDY